MRLSGCLAIGFLALAPVAPAMAQDSGISIAQGRLRTAALELTDEFAPADVRQLLSETPANSTPWTQAEFDAKKEPLAALAAKLWVVRSGSTVLAPRDVRVEPGPDDKVSFHVAFPLPAPADKITLQAAEFAGLPPGHRQFVSIADGSGSVIAKKLLSAADASLEISSAAQATGGRGGEKIPFRFWGFLALGIEHIWTGYDHLLFLFGLLVVCRSFRSMVMIISCFTVAHSLTLALATWNVISLPSRSIEPAIAVTIVFVGLQNLWRRGEEPRGRWALTFAFGLIHGFGFANVLRDLGVGSGGQSFTLPLFTFNLGVEVGQIAVAALVLPIVWQLRKSESFVRRGVPALSGLVAATGFYWFLERTIFT